MGNISGQAITIFSIAVMLIAGFVFSFLAKLLKLPKVTGYIVAGIVIGPYLLNAVPKSVCDNMGFISDIALAFIAFGVGENFKLKVIKENGVRAIIISLCEAVLSSGLVFTVLYFILRLDFIFSLSMAALAVATTPTSTVMTIRQLNAKGRFVNTLLEVIAIDDIVSLLAFGVALSFAESSSGLGFILPIIYNFLSLAAGVGLGFLIKIFIKNRSNDSRLIILVAVLFIFCGFCSVLGVNPLLGCIAMGAVYANICDDEGKLFSQLSSFSPPIILLYFVKSGISFDLGALLKASEISLAAVCAFYFIVRIIGKYFGSTLGCVLTKSGKKESFLFGLALIPQSSVAIGLAEFAARTLNSEVGMSLMTVILASSILYELTGPICAKYAIQSCGEE